MKIKWLSLAGLFILLMSVATFLLVTQLKIEKGWNGKDEPSLIMSNKVWKLTFTEKLNNETINEETVFVTNEKGEKISTNISLSNDKRTLLISPPTEGYDLSVKSYKLHLSKDIKSIYGRTMNSKKEIDFVVKETLPVVGSKDKLDEYFSSILDEEKRFNFFSRTEVEESKTSEDSSAGSSQEISETNIQVQGVDESDIVKTNGTHIFQVVDGKVNIIETNDGKGMKLQNTITFPNSFHPTQLFLHDEKLLVIGYSYEEIKELKNKRTAEDVMIAPRNDMTKAIVYNIASPISPKEERTISLDGHMVSTRKIDSQVYLVTNQYPQYWIMRENKNVDLRPMYSDSSVDDEKMVVDYNKIQYFPDSKEANYTMIAAFDLEKPTEEAKITTYLGSGNQMYMSMENLYLAVQDWGTLVDGNEEVEHTTIYKFSIDGLEVEYDSTAEIEGRILNQFSMDEHDGYFRVAVTKGNMWDESRPSANNLFIFDENLELVSSIEDLARGERIYSARFMGERIYIVTFRETDPLFVIDASNPKTPKVLGELKIPGFSNYLHPYDENHLIGFGYDTKSVQQKGGSEPLILTQGIKLSFFDITDMNNPKEKFTEIIGGRGTYSQLNYDHKALLFNKGKSIFAFPINVYQSVEGNEFDSKFEFQGAYIYNLSLEKGFTLKSKITHMIGSAPYEEWESEIQRLIYIDGTLYALSNTKVTSHQLDNYKFIEELLLN